MRKQRAITFSHFLHSRRISLQFMLVPGILLAVLLGMFLKSGVSGVVFAASSAANTICNQWNYVSSPNVGTGDGLDGVAAISSSDIWAVGSTYNGSKGLTLAEHYNGTQWTVVPTPNPSGAAGASLSGVAAISSTDVWAVGAYWDSSNFPTLTLIEHWNGTNWTIVSSPNPGSGQDAFLNSVAAVSSTDVWAAGVSDVGTVIEQWNGTTWNVVPSPNPGISPYLTSVAAVSATNAWTVGYDYNSSGYTQTLIEHWNGSSWTVASSPNNVSLYNELTGVAVSSATNVWAVGSSASGINSSQTLVEHWNGKSWSIVASPNPSSASGLSAIIAISNTNAWAVGSYRNSTGTKDYSLIEHWNGTKWKTVPPSTPGTASSSLSAVTRIPGTSSLWAVGGNSTKSVAHTLTEYYC